MTATDLSNMLGDDPPKRKMGRPTNAERAARAEVESEQWPHFSKFRQPVGITFLADVLGKQPKQIAKRLEKCPVKSWKTHQGKPHPEYDFLTSMAYLIPPKGDIEDWYSQQNAASLPPFLNKMFWDAMHQRNRVMLESNDLWHTDDVMRVFGRAAMAIRSSMKEWIEDLPEKDGLSGEQYNALIDATNRLMGDIRKILIESPRESLPVAVHIKEELETSGRMVADADRPDDELDE